MSTKSTYILVFNMPNLELLRYGEHNVTQKFGHVDYYGLEFSRLVYNSFLKEMSDCSSKHFLMMIACLKLTTLGKI